MRRNALVRIGVLFPIAGLMAWLGLRLSVPLDDSRIPASVPAESVTNRPGVPSEARMELAKERQPPRGVPDHAFPRDHLKPALVMAEVSGPSRWPGCRERIQLLDTGHSHHRYIRVVEQVLSAPGSAGEVLRHDAMVADNLLVRLRPGKGRTELETLLARRGGRIDHAFALTGLYLVQLPAVSLDAVPEAVAAFMGEAAMIAYAEPNYLVYPSRIPNDPGFTNLWAMLNTGQPGSVNGSSEQTNGLPGVDIGATRVWDVATGGTNVIVAVIDTGVDYRHEDLAANMWVNAGEIPTNGVDDDGNGYVDDVYGMDAYSGDGDPYPSTTYEEEGHGTHCAGTIAGVGNNGIGVAGVCWQARIMGLRFLGDGAYGAIDDAIECVDYAIQMGAHVLNNSWGSTSFSQAGYDAMARAGEHNILSCCAAGNEAEDNDEVPHYPSSYDLDCILAVAASHRTDGLSYFSCYGSTSVDLAAPGSGILSTLPLDGYEPWSGTSMACPHVAGAAALLHAVDPSLSALAIKDILMRSVTTNALFAGKVASNGRMNLWAALNEVLQGIRFDRTSYYLGEWAGVAIGDPTLQGVTSRVALVSTSVGDTETLNLMEMQPGDFRFTNRIMLVEGAVPVSGNGLLEATNGAILWATYQTSEGLTRTGTAVISHALRITITTPNPTEVAYATTNFQVTGFNNGNVAVAMAVRNADRGTTVYFQATNAWVAPPIALTSAVNTIYVYGTNAYGQADTQAVVIYRLGPAAITNYVSSTGSQTWPYDTWAKASHDPVLALAAAAPGNVVQLAAETFVVEDLQLVRPVTVRGMGRTATTLYAGSGRRCASVLTNAAVESLALMNGQAPNGGAVWMKDGYVRDCLIRDNAATENGGGVYCAQGGVVENCELRDNAGELGGGIYFYRGGAATNCVVWNNRATNLYLYLWVGRGGGLFAYRGGRVDHCLIYSNKAAYGAGLYLEQGGVVSGSTIHGHTNQALYLSGGGTCMASSITNNLGAGGVVIYDGGMVSNCLVAGNRQRGTEDGGGLYIFRRALVSDCVIRNNTAPGGNAGGIYAISGGLSNGAVVRNSLILDNHAARAGGVQMDLGGILENCAVMRNAADEGQAGGVALHAVTTDRTLLQNCTVAYNTATTSGGGLQASGSGNMVSGCIIYENRAPLGELGLESASSVAFTSCCVASNPGGIGHILSPPRLAGIHNPHLLTNSPAINAGAATATSWPDIDGEPRKTGAAMDIGCDEVHTGGLVGPLSSSIYVPTTNAVQGSVFTLWSDVTGRVTRLLWTFGDGTSLTNEGIATHTWATTGSVDVVLTAWNLDYPSGVASTVRVLVGSANLATYADASGANPVYPFTSWSTAATSLQQAVDACLDGGVVSVAPGVYRASSADASNVVRITRNLRVQGSGDQATTILEGDLNQGVRCVYMSDGLLTGVTLTRGKPPSGTDGGGAYMDRGGILSNCLVQGCNAPMQSGGGAYVNGGGRIYDCRFASNSASSGGGVYLNYDYIATGRVAGCTFYGNSSANMGGGAYMNFAGELERCRVISNGSASGGGGIYISQKGVVRNTLLAGNSAQTGGGVGFSYATELENCTVVGNVASNRGGGLDVTIGTTAKIRNCIVWDNVAPANPASSYSNDVSYSCLNTPFPGLGNQTNQPRFVHAAEGDYHLSFGSPAANAGVMTASLSAWDLDGHARVVDDVIDLGAYELDPLPASFALEDVQRTVTVGEVYHFGAVLMSESRTVHFYLRNLGERALLLTGTPVVEVEENSGFRVVQQPLITTLTNQAVVPVDLLFTPVVSGRRSARVTIRNSDRDFQFDVDGTGVGTAQSSLVLEERFDQAPQGWTADGDWQFGLPLGGGGENGSPDPSMGWSGLNVYGYNLAGDYLNGDAVPRHLISQAINCSEITEVRLNFQRWLGVEGHAADHASVAVSRDGTLWTTIWSNPAEALTDFVWTNVDLDISSVADTQGAVFVRWTLGGVDETNRYCGWNLDDVLVYGRENANNKARLSFSSESATVSETSGVASIMVTRDWNTDQPVAVDFATGLGTASAGVDYLATSGTLYFAAGEVSRAIQLILLDDQLQEVEETIPLRLSHPSANALLGRYSNLVVTLVSDDLGVLDISPTNAFLPAGFTAGPFSPTQLVYQLTNSGSAVLDWSLQWTNTWLVAAPTSGTLVIGGTTSILVRATTNLPVMKKGLYGDSLVFSNRSTGVRETRVASLTITPPAEPMVWLQVDETSGTRATNAGVLGGTYPVTNGIWGGTEGRVGGAVWLSGLTGSGLYLGNHPTLNYAASNEAFTISIWFRRTNTASTVLFSKANTETNRCQWYLSLESGRIYAVAGGGARVYVVTNVLDDAWHLATLVNSGTNQFTLFVDGRAKTNGLAGSQGPTNENATVGRRSSGWGVYSNGWVDEVRIYDRALSAHEVSNLHARAVFCTLMAEAVGPGTVTPSGTVQVARGGWTNFLLVANTYYHIADVLTNGVSTGQGWNMPTNTFIWSNLVSDATLRVHFAENLTTNTQTPEWWLAQHGLSNDFAAQAAFDQDGDGLPAWQEQVAGTDPTNRDSVLKMQSYGGGASGRVVRWTSVPGHFYAVEWTTNVAGEYFELSNRVEATAGTNSLLDGLHPEERSLFYRVRVVP